MTLEIHVLAWHMNKKVAVLNWLMFDSDVKTLSLKILSFVIFFHLNLSFMELYWRKCP